MAGDFGRLFFQLVARVQRTLQTRRRRASSTKNKQIQSTSQIDTKPQSKGLENHAPVTLAPVPLSAEVHSDITLETEQELVGEIEEAPVEITRVDTSPMGEPVLPLIESPVPESVEEPNDVEQLDAESTLVEPNAFEYVTDPVSATPILSSEESLPIILGPDAQIEAVSETEDIPLEAVEANEDETDDSHFNEEQESAILRVRAQQLFWLPNDPLVSPEDLKQFLELLETGTLDEAFPIDALERLLRAALQNLELIGELPISQEAFLQLCAILRVHFAGKRGRPSLRSARCPALFVTTMVFCARYSDDDARNFWSPYARIVWQQAEIDQSLRNVCVRYFRLSRVFLEERCNITFSVVNSGDVVRPIYHHAILPHYLQDDLADWLIKVKLQVAEVPFEAWKTLLPSVSGFPYLAPRLRHFVLAEDTAEIAYHLVQQMKRAYDLYLHGEDPQWVRIQLASPIEQSLWEKIAYSLAVGSGRTGASIASRPRVDWVWALQDDALCLRLLNFSIEQRVGRPAYCTVESPGEDQDESGYWVEELRPWGNGDYWLVDPILITDYIPNGRIKILSETRDLLYEANVPPFPDAPFALFRITQQRAYGVLVDHHLQIADGDWLLSFAGDVEIFNDQGQVLRPRERLEPPELLQEMAQHRQAGQYELHLPVVVRQASQELAVLEKRQVALGQPYIVGDAPSLGVSSSVPPVFLNTNIRLVIPNFAEKQHAVTLSMRSNTTQVIHRLEDLVSGKVAYRDGSDVVVDLGALTPLENATYEISLRRNLIPLISVPLQFAVLPEVMITAPDPDVLYSPGYPPSVLLSGLTLDQIEVEGSARTEVVGDEIEVTWLVLERDECRLRLRFGAETVLLGWRIPRVSAWISGIEGDLVRDDQVGNVYLHARGEKLGWLLEGEKGKAERPIQLGAKQRYDRILQDDALHELLKAQGSDVEVYAQARGMMWRVFTYQRCSPTTAPVPAAPVTEKPKLSERLEQIRPAPVRRPEKTPAVPSSDEQNRHTTIGDWLASVRAGEKVLLTQKDIYYLATSPTTLYEDASSDELQSLWSFLPALAEVPQLDSDAAMWEFPDGVVNRRFTENQLQTPHSRYSRAPGKLTTVDGYRYAADNWITDNKHQRILQERMVKDHFSKLRVRKARESLTIFPWVPIIAHTQELLDVVSEEYDYQHPLMRLDEAVLLLALLLRLEAYYPHYAGRWRIDAGIKNNVIQEMLSSASRACPGLLRWSLTWVELFYVHGH